MYEGRLEEKIKMQNNITNKIQSQQVLITNMINRNKTQKTIELPRIPLLLQNRRLLNQEQPVKQRSNSKSKPKDNENISQSKENSVPHDLKNATIYLQFPIGKKKCTIDYPYQLKIQKLNEESMFANRAACAVFRRDVRARMYKYDEERMQSLTERNINNSPFGQIADRHQYFHRKEKNRQAQNYFRGYQGENCWFPEKQAKKLIRNFQVTRWESNSPHNDLNSSCDQILQQILQQSKFPKIN